MLVGAILFDFCSLECESDRVGYNSMVARFKHTSATYNSSSASKELFIGVC